MGDPLRHTWVCAPQDPLETGSWRHSDRRCCTDSSKIICKRSNSCKCRQADRLCTSGFPSGNCCNQTNRPPIPRPGPGRGSVLFQDPRPTGVKIPGWAMTLPVHLSHRRPVILPCCTNQRCGQDVPTGRRRRRPRGPSAHQDHLPQKPHTNSHLEQESSFKPYPTNKRSGLIPRTCHQSQQWRHVGGQFWREQLQLRLCRVAQKFVRELGQKSGTRDNHWRNCADERWLHTISWVVFLPSGVFH